MATTYRVAAKSKTARFSFFVCVPSDLHSVPFHFSSIGNGTNRGDCDQTREASLATNTANHCDTYTSATNLHKTYTNALEDQ